ncbi:MAG: ABC transporter substrate-binding protein [Thiogranum sp.]
MGQRPQFCRLARRVAVTLGLLAALFTAPLVAGSAATDTPQATIRAVTGQVLALLRANQDTLRKDPAAVAAQVAKIVDPHLDFTIMSQEALGVGWRRADQRQRTRFTQAFHQLLTDDYAAVLKRYSGETVKLLDVRWDDTTHHRAIVSSRLEAPGKQAVQVDYRMYHTGGSWKVYDVVVDGVSLLLNYRQAFASELQHEDLDTLISRLAHKAATDEATASQ